MVWLFRFVLCFAEPLVSYMLLIQSLPNGCNLCPSQLLQGLDQEHTYIHTGWEPLRDIQDLDGDVLQPFCRLCRSLPPILPF
jgi:hypothetical protein